MESIRVSPFEMKAGIDLRARSLPSGHALWTAGARAEVKGEAFAKQKCEAKRSTLYFSPRGGDDADVEGLRRPSEIGPCAAFTVSRPSKRGDVTRTKVDWRRRSRSRTARFGDCFVTFVR